MKSPSSTAVAAVAGVCVGLFVGINIGGLFAIGACVGRETRRRRKILTTKVRADRAALYKRHHNGVWPEVESALAASGVETLSIWSDQADKTRLYMYIEEADDAGERGPGSAYRRSEERVQQWEECMETAFHDGWAGCDEIYSLKVWPTPISPQPPPRTMRHVTSRNLTGAALLRTGVWLPARPRIFQLDASVLRLARR